MPCPAHRRGARPDCLACHLAELAPDVTGGQFYGHTHAGAWVALGPDAPDARAPDVWVCRRLADFPGRRVPAGGEVATCDRCQAPIVFNPARQVAAPKRCFQCCDVQPLPLES